MTILLGIDFETTGLDATKDKIIEVGMVLWDTDPNQMVECASFLIDPGFDGDKYHELPKSEAQGIHGITDQMLFGYGTGMSSVESWLMTRGLHAECFVAHNTAFEKSFLPQLEIQALEILNQPWIDTHTDIPGHQGKSLQVLAADHGLINIFPHRALTDVLIMMKVLSLHPFDLILAENQAEKMTVIVKFDYNEARIQLIKSFGFHWHAQSKSWRKAVKEAKLAEEFAGLEASGFTPQIYASNGT